MTRGRKDHKEVTKKEDLKDQEEARKQDPGGGGEGPQGSDEKGEPHRPEGSGKDWTPEVVARKQKVTAKDQRAHENDNHGETSKTRGNRKIGALGHRGIRGWRGI